MKELLMIVPTRGRPENVARQQQSLKETRTSTADVLYAVDADDPSAMDYIRMGLSNLAIGPRLRLGGTLNFLSGEYTDLYRNIGFMGDDHLPRTPFWDQRILEAMDPDRPQVVYGNDLLQGRNLPTAVVLPSRMIDALGYMCPPGFTHLWLDNVWLTLGLRLDTLTYLEHVVLEHMHPAAGKAHMDAGYQEVNHPTVDAADHAAYDAWLASPGGAAAAVDRVRKAYGL